MNEEPDDREVEKMLSTINRCETRFSDLAKRVHNLDSSTLSILSQRIIEGPAIPE